MSKHSAADRWLWSLPSVGMRLFGFLAIGAIGSAVGSLWVLAFFGMVVVAIGIEWVAVDETRVFVAGIIGNVVAWAPVAGTILFVAAAERASEKAWTVIVGFFVVIAASILPMWTLGYSCTPKGGDPVPHACAFAEALPTYLPFKLAGVDLWAR